MRLDGKTVVVSGGASGLGGATAEMVVQNGGNVLILGGVYQPGAQIPDVIFNIHG